MYCLKLIKDKTIRNSFIIDNFEFYSFLSSRERGEFNKLEGHEVLRYGIYDGENLIGVFPLFTVKAKRGTYFLIPHCPLIKGDFFSVMREIIPELKKIAKIQGVSFLRINSTQLNTVDNKKAFSDIGFMDAPMHVNVEDTHLLDLTKSEDELFKNMRKNNRYIIKRARKEGVEVVIDNSEDKIQALIDLHMKHAKKVKYHAFSEKFIRNLFQIFDKDQITLMGAYYEGVLEASLIIIKYGEMAAYYISASDIKHPKFSPAYLLQWESIMNAKENGCKIYNFWGVSPDDNPKHPIAGVSKFKRRFGGYDYSLLHTQDYIFNKKYRINYLVETIRRIKRGYYYKKPE